MTRVGDTYLDFRNRQVTVVSIETEGTLVSRSDDAGMPELWMVDSRILAAVITAQRVVGPYLGDVGSSRRSFAAAVQGYNNSNW